MADMKCKGSDGSDAIWRNDEDEIEGINEKLLQLLKTKIQSFSKNGFFENDADIAMDTHFYEPPPLQCHYKYVNPKTLPHYLLPIGVFWDIENCPVPRGKSAAVVAQVIRDKFFEGYKEAEFIVVCDVYKENKQVIQELNDAQINLIHVAATYKNAADEKLKQSIRRFADIHGSPAAVILISSDINFAADLSDLRHRKKMHVILLHNENSSEALILCANEHYNFMELMESLPARTPSKAAESYDLLVSNLPKDKGLTSIKRRLKQLSDNCGGRVIGINSNAAILRFGLKESANRAQKRMDGEFVFDTKISVRSVKEKKSRKVEENISTVDVSGESKGPSSSPIPMYTVNSAFVGVRSLPGTPQYHSSSPLVGNFTGWNVPHCASTNSGMMPQTSTVSGRPFSANGDISYNRSFHETSRIQSPVWPQMTSGHQADRGWEEPGIVDMHKNYGKLSACSPGNGRSHTPEGMRRIRGTHNTMSHSQEWSSGAIYRPKPLSNAYNDNGFGQGKSFKRRSPSPMYTAQNRDWNTSSHFSGRNSRTPSPFQSGVTQMPPSQNRTSPYQHFEPSSEEVERFFNPINNRNVPHDAASQPVELLVTNLDQNIVPKEMRHILYSMFIEHVGVLHVSIFMQSDGNYAASVKVGSLQDAQYAISQLHRQKVGYKRILISYAHTGGPNPQLVRSQIVILLQEVPGHKLPLFKFREMYESRFMISISVSELYKMKDVCIVTEDPGGRMVALSPEYRNTPSPCLENLSQNGELELPYCIIHFHKPWSDKGWAEQEVASLPNVAMPLTLLKECVNQLLLTHNGNLPLSTFPNCYEAEFKQALAVDEHGVPLEHLISCLSTVEMKQGPSSVKYLTWKKENRDDANEESKCISPALANQLSLFSREVVDLLKTAPHCQIPFNRFIPAYHHHFGRQCRVADYGFTKLIDLLEALPQTVQVMGEGNNRVVTLSHRAQIRRFTSDLLRVLKAQASKQITLSELPTVYTRVIAKPWDVMDYGICEIGDILSEVSENTVVVNDISETDKLISIPKREQTAEEIEKTKQFAVEVVELLRHAPQCTMLFNKFVPSYHHHFGHQCRVADYGVTKLIELFEAIPHVIKIEDTPSGERRITLTEHESLRVLGEQISKLITKNQNGLLLSNLSQYFLRVYGYMLRPEVYGCNSIQALVEKLSSTLKIVGSSKGPSIELIDKSHLQQLGLQCRRILMDHLQHQLPIEDFKRIYHQFYGSPCDINEIQNELPEIVQFSIRNNEQIIQLTPLQRFACHLYKVLMKHDGKLNLQKFEIAYLSMFNAECKVMQYGYSSLLSLLQALPCTVIIKEARQKKKTIFLNKKLAAVGIELPLSLKSPYCDRTSNTDSPSSNSSNKNVDFNQPGVYKSPEKNYRNTWGESSDTNWQQGNQWNDFSYRWPTPKSDRNSYLKNLIQPEKSINSSDSAPDDHDDSGYQWKSSVWSTPPKFTQNVASTSVPPITLPLWDTIENEDGASSLLSPTKNLLPATANPLNPPTSPFLSVHDQIVIPPHPSKLPLPSLSLSSKRSMTSTTKNDDQKECLLMGNSLEIHSPNNSENCSVSDGDSFDNLNISNKQCGSGKRRLAAQFDLSID